MFVQARAPGNAMGPIKIEGVHGSRIASRLRTLAEENAYETFIIGLHPTDAPDELAEAIYEQHAAARLHHDWFEPTIELITFIQLTAQQALTELLASVRPGGMPEGAVDIETIAQLIGVSVPTVRRLVKAGDIPYLRMGKALRFIAADVLASLERRDR